MLQPCLSLFPMMSSGERDQDDVGRYVVSTDEAGLRLDVFLAGRIEDASRSLIKQAIKDERVRLKDRVVKRPGRALLEGDEIEVRLPPAPVTEVLPEDIPLDVVFEDSDILVVNKSSGLVVHPAPGHATGTLVNAVLHHCSDFEMPSDERVAGRDFFRPGIVHRLDRFTSGVMVVAKTQRAFDSLSDQARRHAFERCYVALVQGEFKEDSGVIRASIGRSLSDRKRMSVTSVNAREAVTRFRVRERLGVASYIELRLETGRTHQIRVHLRFAGHPILGDMMYGVTDFSHWGVGVAVRRALEGLEGQALHAELLGLVHPRTGEKLLFEAPPPPDFQEALSKLRTLRSQ